MSRGGVVKIYIEIPDLVVDDVDDDFEIMQMVVERIENIDDIENCEGESVTIDIEIDDELTEQMFQDHKDDTDYEVWKDERE